VTVGLGALVIVLAALALQAIVNTRWLTRLDAMPARAGAAAILVPARNESRRIAAAVRGWLAQRGPRVTLSVYDDDSTDDTAAIARGAMAGDARARVLAGGPLPDGWRGKPHACHRLRAATEAEILIFADADVVPAPSALSHILGAMAVTGADALSVLPRHDHPRVLMRALAGLQGWAALTLIPWWLGPRRGPGRGVLNGQLVAIRARVYDAVGGFGAVRESLAEDAALGRRLAARGHRLAVLDAAGLLRCVPYDNPAELWEANVRNLAAVLYGSALLTVGGALALVLLHVGPLILVAAALVQGGPLAWPLGALALALLPRRLADRRAGHHLGVTLLHPVAAAGLAAMMLASWWRVRRRRTVEWSGRRYRASDRAA